MQKVCHSGEGVGGSGKKMTKCDMGGRGVNWKSDITHPKIQSNKFSFLQFSIFKRPQSSLKIEPFWPSMYLKSFLTPYLVADSVVFESSKISFHHCCFHTLITSHRFPFGISSIFPVHITFFFMKKFVTFWWVTWGEEGREKRWLSVTWGEGGSKMALFGVTYFLHGPLGYF